MENQKNKSKKILPTYQKKLTKRLREFSRNLSEDGKIKKANYANHRNKNMTDAARERKKEYL